MKYVVLVGDGMADYPCKELSGQTPLQYARTPHMDFLASHGTIGLVKTIPEECAPGSDVANLSLLGYDPRLYYTGRAPLEAVSMDIQLGQEDVAFRCNLVTLSEEPTYRQKHMVDYSAGEISSEEARELIDVLNYFLGNKDIRFYAGISYRHLMVWKKGPLDVHLTPPHDISGLAIADFLPKGPGSDFLFHLMENSYHILKNHPINEHRRHRRMKPATSIWFWGQGKQPDLPSFFDKYGLSGGVISAVDLIRGIGICAGLDVIKVEGATGNLHTNYRGKAQAAQAALRAGKDFVYIHVEAPDEAAHHGSLEDKVKAIEEIDEKVLGELLSGLKEFNRYRLMLLPDHPTPLCTRTHSADPVPFVIFDYPVRCCTSLELTFDEVSAQKSNLRFCTGHELMNYFLLATLKT